ncbi:hypothetical protein H4S07_005630, partial [Coemansia furcata]
RNLFDTIDSLVKSGKAKPVFDWSMALDTVLLNEAKARRVDLKLVGIVGIKDDASTTLTPAPVRPAIFSDIGEPGAFDKLYDDDLVHAEPPVRISLVENLSVPVVEAACLPTEQILCLDSEGEGSVGADILDDVDNLSLADLEYLTPGLAIPETPPMMEVDEEEPAISNAEPPAPPVVVVCIDDDDDIDADLLAFNLDGEELFELSDDDRASASACPSMIEDVDATPPLLSSSPVQRHIGRLVRGKPAKKSASAGYPTSVITPPRDRQMLKKRKLRQPPTTRAPNPFIDNEAGIGDSDDDERGRRTGTGLRQAARFSDDDEDGSEDLDENLSSFIVEDDHVEFETPVHHGHAPDDLSPGQNDVTPRRIGDYYRQSLAYETTP